ncbi:MAG: hypothetical protein JWQ72_292, partial [Polaromonas sp.]|nr:hypothetical protein [Polaromonas sp.]
MNRKTLLAAIAGLVLLGCIPLLTA